MARTKQIKKVKATTETTKTTMSLEQFQEMNAVILETKDFSLYNSETLLQYHLWKLYIKMSQEPDLDMDEFLKDIPLNPESTEKPPPSEKKKKKTTKAEPTDELIIARARYKAMFDKAPGRMKLENIYKKIDNEEPIDSYDEEAFNQGIPDLLQQYKDKNTKKSPRASSPKKSPKKSSPKASPTKKKQPSQDPMLKKNPDLDDHLVQLRSKYYSMYGKWPHGKMKHTTLQKKIDEAIGDMEPAQPNDEEPKDEAPKDEELVAQIAEDTQDLVPDDTTYEKILYQGVEYTFDANTSQMYNENHELVAHKDESGVVVWVDDKFLKFHTLDDDYEAPDDIDDGSETETEE